MPNHVDTVDASESRSGAASLEERRQRRGLRLAEPGVLVGAAGRELAGSESVLKTMYSNQISQARHLIKRTVTLKEINR